MELSEVLIEVREAIRDALSIREGKKVSLSLIRPNFKIFKHLDKFSLTDLWMAIEERFPQLERVADSVKEQLLIRVHTAADLAVVVDHMIKNIEDKGK